MSNTRKIRVRAARRVVRAILGGVRWGVFKRRWGREPKDIGFDLRKPVRLSPQEHAEFVRVLGGKANGKPVWTGKVPVLPGPVCRRKTDASRHTRRGVLRTVPRKDQIVDNVGHNELDRDKLLRDGDGWKPVGPRAHGMPVGMLMSTSVLVKNPMWRDAVESDPELARMYGASIERVERKRKAKRRSAEGTRFSQKSENEMSLEAAKRQARAAMNWV